MNADLAIQLLIAIIQQAGNVTKLLDKARSEGRDVTDQELADLRTQDDEARAKLAAAIEAKANPGL